MTLCQFQKLQDGSAVCVRCGARYVGPMAAGPIRRVCQRRPKTVYRPPEPRADREAAAHDLLLRASTVPPRPGRRTPHQVAPLIHRLARAGQLDAIACDRGRWQAIEDLFAPDRWRAEWGDRPYDPPLLNPGERPRVAFLNPVFGLGGTERWTLDLVAAMEPVARCEVVVVARPQPAELARLEAVCPAHVLAIDQIERFLIDGGFHLTISWGLTQLPKIVGRFRPNVICCHGSDLDWSSSYPRAARCVAERYVAASRAALAPLVAAGVQPWQSTVIHNGVDPSRLISSVDRAAIRRRYGIGENEFVACYVGRYSAEKRVDLLVAALQQMPAGFRGLIMGDGPMLADYRAADRAGRCLFLPHAYQIGDCLAAADCFVGLCREEGFWYGGAEAALVGLPLVALRVGILQELADALPAPLPWLELDADLTAADLAEALMRCRRDPPDARRLTEAIQRYSVLRMAAGWADLIRDVAQSSSVPAASPPTCSILLPVRDTPAVWLAECWHSIESQEPGWELVLVDDGSRDPATVAQIDRIADDPRVRLMRLPQSGGVAAALNAGLTACRAEIIVRIDADDVMLPGRLALQRRLLRARPEVSILGGQLEPFAIDGRAVHAWPPRAAVIDAAEVDRQIVSGEGVWIVNHPAVAFRRSAILGVGGYPGEYPRCEDLALWLRCIRAGLIMANHPEPVACYRLHPGQITATPGLLAEAAAIVAREWTAHRTAPVTPNT